MTIPTFEEWKKDIDAEVATMDRVIKLMQQLRDSLALQSYPMVYSRNHHE